MDTSYNKLAGDDCTAINRGCDRLARGRRALLMDTSYNKLAGDDCTAIDVVAIALRAVAARC
jgi:hypothetical protein